MTPYDDYQKRMATHAKWQTQLAVFQSACLIDMGRSLDQLNGEMREIRKANLEAVAIQQEMIQRDNLQSHLEELIYNTQKMVAEFSAKSCDAPSVVRYFSLFGVTKTVQQLGKRRRGV